MLKGADSSPRLQSAPPRSYGNKQVSVEQKNGQEVMSSLPFTSVARQPLIFSVVRQEPHEDQQTRGYVTCGYLMDDNL